MTPKGIFHNRSGVRDIKAHSEKVHTVDWNCDGRRIASGSYDKAVAVISLDRDRLIREHLFRGHQDAVDQLCWHRNHPDLVASASADKTVRIWDARQQQRSATVISTKGENLNITWSNDGSTIAVGNKEDLVSFIDVRTAKIKKEEQFKFEVNEISWNLEGDLFFLTTGSGQIYVLSYPELEVLHSIQAHPSNCICLKFSLDGSYFATGSADALVSLWDPNELYCLRTFSRLEWPVRTLGFSHDAKLLASGSEDLLIDISSVETGEHVTKISTEAPTFTLAWHPGKYLLVYACDDKDSKDKFERERDGGTIKVFGFSSD